MSLAATSCQVASFSQKMPFITVQNTVSSKNRLWYEHSICLRMRERAHAAADGLARAAAWRG